MCGCRANLDTTHVSWPLLYQPMLWVRYVRELICPFHPIALVENPRHNPSAISRCRSRAPEAPGSLGPSHPWDGGDHPFSQPRRGRLRVLSKPRRNQGRLVGTTVHSPWHFSQCSFSNLFEYCSVLPATTLTNMLADLPVFTFHSVPIDFHPSGIGALGFQRWTWASGGGVTSLILFPYLSSDIRVLWRSAFSSAFCVCREKKQSAPKRQSANTSRIL